MVELTSPSAVPLRATARVNFELMTQLQLNIVGDSAATARLEVSVRPLRVIFFPGILMPDLYLDIYLTCPSTPSVAGLLRGPFGPICGIPLFPQGHEIHVQR